MGIKISQKQRKKPRLSNVEVIKKQDKNHKQTSSKHWSAKPEILGSIPSRVTSSVVQDNSPNNLGLGGYQHTHYLQTV